MINREKGETLYHFLDGVGAAKCTAEKINRSVKSQNWCAACLNWGGWTDSGRWNPFDVDKFCTFMSEWRMTPANSPSTEDWETESSKDHRFLELELL